jgi:hypothetical protein
VGVEYEHGESRKGLWAVYRRREKSESVDSFVPLGNGIVQQVAELFVGRPQVIQDEFLMAMNDRRRKNEKYVRGGVRGMNEIVPTPIGPASGRSSWQPIQGNLASVFRTADSLVAP